MSERGLSEEAMLSSLRDIRLPAEAAGGIVADMLVGIGLAGLAVLLVVGVLRVFSTRRTMPRPPTLAQQLSELDGASAADRRVGLLHLLRAHAPDRYRDVAQRLYHPDAVDLPTLEAEVSRLV